MVLQPRVGVARSLTGIVTGIATVTAAMIVTERETVNEIVSGTGARDTTTARTTMGTMGVTRKGMASVSVKGTVNATERGTVNVRGRRTEKETETGIASTKGMLEMSGIVGMNASVGKVRGNEVMGELMRRHTGMTKRLTM
jgi:hypothetical protein